MARKYLGYFLPLVIGLVGQASLLVLLILLRQDVFSSVVYRTDIIPLRSIALAAGIGILSAILFKFGAKFKQNPTQTRLTVLLAIVAMVPSAILYFIVTTWQFNDAIGTLYDVSRYFIDGTLLCLMASIYCFVVFGLEILLSPTIKQQVFLLKRVTDISFASVLLFYYAASLAQVFPGSIPFLQNLGDVPFYLIAGIGLYYLVVLVLMAVKCFGLTSKVGESGQRTGLVSLGITFLILIACIILLVLNFVVFDSSKEIIVASMWLFVAGFIFIYQGFVRPTVSKP